MEKLEKITEQVGPFLHLSTQESELKWSSGSLENAQESLVRRLKAGEHEAAEQLVDAFYRQLYWFMRRMGHRRDTSEDLVQETFLQAWEHVGQLRSPQALRAWMYQLAANVSRAHWRRSKHEPLVSLELFDGEIAREPQSSKAHYDELVQLRAAVETLPRKLKEAVVVHYMQHLTISESCAALGINEGTLKSRLSRALELMRKRLD